MSVPVSVPRAAVNTVAFLMSTSPRDCPNANELHKTANASM
jgi:hypothetical protein